MDLFNKAKLRLDSQTTAGGLRDLCKIGVLSPKQFLQALHLSKDNKKWDRLLVNTMLLFGVIFIALAFISLAYQNWDSIPFFYKMMLTQIIFVVSTIGVYLIGDDKPVGKGLILLGVLDIGLMLFAIDKNYPTIKETWGVLGQWLLLIIPWAIYSRSSLLWLFALGLFNCMSFLWGYQSAIPNGLINWQILLILICSFNLFFLLVSEMYTTKVLRIYRPYLWIILLIAVMSLTLFLASVSILSGDFFSFEMFYFVAVAIALVWFYLTNPRYLALVIVGCFSSFFVLGVSLKLTIEILEKLTQNLLLFVGGTAILFAMELFIVTLSLSWLIYAMAKRREQGLMQ